MYRVQVSLVHLTCAFLVPGTLYPKTAEQGFTVSALTTAAHHRDTFTCIACEDGCDSASDSAAAASISVSVSVPGLPKLRSCACTPVLALIPFAFIAFARRAFKKDQDSLVSRH